MSSSFTVNFVKSKRRKRMEDFYPLSMSITTPTTVPKRICFSTVGTHYRNHGLVTIQLKIVVHTEKPYFQLTHST